MKTKNPLYVVKGQNVEQAKSILDMLLKRFDLEPAVRLLQQVLELLLAQVKSYPVFVAVKTILDQWFAQLVPLLQQLSLLVSRA